MLRIAVIGLGALGARAARQLASTPAVDAVLVHDVVGDRRQGVVDSIGQRAGLFPADGSPAGLCEAVVLALPAGRHTGAARRFLDAGIPIVSASDAIVDVEGLLDLDSEAREREVTIAVGAGFSPGFTCVLARHGAVGFDRVEEIHVSKVGTGGPACARQHHHALAGRAIDWRDGGWVERRGGSGRELCWFPDPVGPRDCYRAALPDALLLVRAFPGVERVTARVAANRRDRVTARVPMLRRPHAEGGPGAVRVEVRGTQGRSSAARVLGAMDRPAMAAGAVAAVTAVLAAQRRLGRSGAAGLAELAEPLPLLAELAQRGIKAAVFEGAERQS